MYSKAQHISSTIDKIAMYMLVHSYDYKIDIDDVAIISLNSGRQRIVI